MALIATAYFRIKAERMLFEKEYLVDVVGSGGVVKDLWMTASFLEDQDILPVIDERSGRAHSA